MGDGFIRYFVAKFRICRETFNFSLHRFVHNGHTGLKTLFFASIDLYLVSKKNLKQFEFWMMILELMQNGDVVEILVRFFRDSFIK